MSVRDALLLNTTGSSFQALQTNDTARVKGDLSLQKDDGTEVLGIDVSTATLNLTGGITGSGNISSSLSSTGSFGRVIATTFHGDGSALKSTLPRSVGIVTQSAQLAAQISGAFTAGFEMSASISGSATSTGSFGRVEGEFFFGDGSGLASTLPRSPGILTGSAQIASRISGSFNKGFNTSGDIKGATVTAGGTWSAGGALGSAITYNAAAGDKCGQIVGLGTDGGNASELATLDTTRTFEYNGSTWSEAGDNVTNRARAAGAGTVNSGLFFGGYTPGWYGTSQGATECYNGTNFSEVNDMIMPRRAHAGAGLSSEAALALGGYLDSAPLNPGFHPNMRKFTEVWNGTNWSESGDAPANMQRHGMAGSVNAAVAFGSNIGPAALTIHWNGSSWSEGGSGHSPIGINNVHGGGQNDAISAGSGYIAPYVYTKRTQYYDGTSWSEGPNMINAYATRGVGHNQGNAAGALAAGGEGGPVTAFGGQTATEEHTGGTAAISGSFGRLEFTKISGDGANIRSSLPYSPGLLSSSAQIASNISGSFNKGFEFSGTIQTAPGGVWSTGGNLNATTTYAAGLGTKSAALSAGTTNTNAKTEEYNGSSWSEVNDLNSGRGAFEGTGTTEAAVVFGGSSNNTYTEEWNGSSWSEVNNLTMGRGGHMKLGITSEAALAVGGSTSEPGYEDNDVESWNGTNWSAGTALPAAAAWGSSAGTYDSGIVFKWPGSETFCWNGSSWSEVADRTLARHCSAGAGSSNDALITGGQSPSISPQINACTELYNGTSWSTGPNLAIARSQLSSAEGGNAGTATTMVFGGGNTATEHYNVNISSASFGRLEATTFHGDASNLQSSLPYDSVVSSSAQIASNISGSFNKGFEFEGTIGVDTAAWSTDANINVARNSGRMADESANAALFFGGRLGTNPANICGQKITEEYNGLSWSEAGNMNINRMSHYGFGSQNAAVATMGITSSLGPVPGSFTNSANTAAGRSAFSKTEHYDGTSWSEVADIINNTRGSSGFSNGTQNAGIVSNGCISSPSGAPDHDECTFIYNGTNWTQVACSPYRQFNGGSAGDSSGMVIGGSSLFHAHPHHSGGPYAYADNRVQEYNCAGDSWTTLPGLSVTHNGGFGFGTTNNTYIGGGQSQPMTPWNVGYHGQVFENFDGSAWSTCANLPTGTSNTEAAGGGPGLYAGGYQGPVHPGSSVATSVASYRWTEFSNALSVGLLNFTSGSGDATSLQGALYPGVLSGSAQIASNISGSFNKGFGFTGKISGSATSTGSFGRLTADKFFGDATGIQSSLPYPSGILSGSAQIASRVSGSFTSGFTYGGEISGSSVKLEYPVVHAKTFIGDATQFTASLFQGLISGSAQISSNISGAFSTGIEHVFNMGDNRQGSSGGVKCSFQAGGVGTGTWKASKSVIIPRGSSRLAGTQNSALLMGGDCVTTNGGCCVEAWDGTAWEERQGLASINNQGFKNSGGYGTQNAAMVTAGRPNLVTETAQYNGSTWSEVNNFNQSRGNYAHSGCSQNDAIMTGGLGADNSSQYSCTEIWDGTTWTEKQDPIRGHGWGHVGGGSSNAFIMGGSYVSPSQTLTEEWDGSSWSSRADNLWSYRYRGQQGDGSIYNFMHFGGTNSYYALNNSVEFFDGVGWKKGPTMLTSVGGAFRAGAGRGFGGGMGEGGGLTVGGERPPVSYHTTAQIFDQEATSTGSFGTLKGFGESTLKTNALFVSGSTFKLPLFSDKDIHYHNLEPQESTGSTSGSFERKPDKDIFTRPGNFFFHSDYNALGYTYQSASIYSQSLDFRTCYYTSASIATTSTGYVTQSHYCYTTVVCYITGSYT